MVCNGNTARRKWMTACALLKALTALKATKQHKKTSHSSHSRCFACAEPSPVVTPSPTSVGVLLLHDSNVMDLKKIFFRRTKTQRFKPKRQVSERTTDFGTTVTFLFIQISMRIVNTIRRTLLSVLTQYLPVDCPLLWTLT